MIIGVTGHRDMQHTNQEVARIIKAQLMLRKPDEVITGMALGYDSLVADVCIELNIPYIGAIPFEGQHLKWSTAQQVHYSYLVSKAKSCVWTDNEGYAIWKFHKRNRWIVDHSDVIMTYYDHRKEGGSYEAVKYAVQQSKEVINIYEQLQNAVSRV